MEPTHDELKILEAAREIAAAIPKQYGVTALAVLAGALRELITREKLTPEAADAVLTRLRNAVRSDYNPRWREVN
jgi:hypothetical protein